MQSQIFVSYSRKDDAEKNKLLSHLSVFKHAGQTGVWSDDRIGVGEDWRERIEEALANADIALLLVTDNFLDSDFIMNKEVPVFLERQRTENLTIVPIIARPCAWQEIDWIEKINVKPRNGNPVWRDGGKYADDELATIVRDIARTIRSKLSISPASVARPVTYRHLLAISLGPPAGPARLLQRITLFSRLLKRKVRQQSSYLNSLVLAEIGKSNAPLKYFLQPESGAVLVYASDASAGWSCAVESRSGNESNESAGAGRTRRRCRPK